MQNTKQITEEQKKEIIREHYSKIGKKGGEVNKKKGSEYFKHIRSLQNKTLQK
jgi:hypothetical protein